MSLHTSEICRGDRFEFGKNWSHFLSTVNEDRIASAQESLKQMLEVENLAGKSFLDIGSGSGLFSLGARCLGARVHSFDFDPHSVACTAELKRRYFPHDDGWIVEEGSILDVVYLQSLGQFDIVYSWGVLHHTGQMWQAMENCNQAVARDGKLFIAIYNDMGSQSLRWKQIKRTYNRLPQILRLPLVLLVIAPNEAKSFLRCLLTRQLSSYVRSLKQYHSRRGMSHWHDIVDWVGGYPYEYAKPEEVFDFYRARGFTLTRMKCGGVGIGCNQFVFVKNCQANCE